MYYTSDIKCNNRELCFFSCKLPAITLWLPRGILEKRKKCALDEGYDQYRNFWDDILSVADSLLGGLNIKVNTDQTKHTNIVHKDHEWCT